MQNVSEEQAEILEKLAKQRDRLDELQLGYDHDGAYKLGKDYQKLDTMITLLKYYDWVKKEEVEELLGNDTH